MTGLTARYTKSGYLEIVASPRLQFPDDIAGKEIRLYEGGMAKPCHPAEKRCTTMVYSAAGF